MILLIADIWQRWKLKKIGTQDAREKLTWLDFQLSALDLPDNLPKGICHSDLHFSNVLFREDKFVGLIDFDDANYTYLVFDLVSLIDSWTWPFQSDHNDLTVPGKLRKPITHTAPS